MSILADYPAHGQKMAKMVLADFGVYIGHGSLYPILRKMERLGLVASPSPDGGTRKRVYALTPDGERAYREGLDAINEIVASFGRYVADRGANGLFEGHYGPTNGSSWLPGLASIIAWHPGPRLGCYRCAHTREQKARATHNRPAA